MTDSATKSNENQDQLNWKMPVDSLVRKPTNRKMWLWLVLATILPSLVTWVYFGLLHGHSAGVQQAAYAIGKGIQFGLPLAVVYFVAGERLQWLRLSRKGLWHGVGFGLVIAVLIYAVYEWIVAGTEVEERLVSSVKAKVSGMGLDSAWKFIAVGVFYSMVHAFLEEYYWRWFVFRRLGDLMDFRWANFWSSVGFMAHHILLLGYFFGFSEWRTYLFGFAIAVGGGVWAELYRRTGNLISCWLSHALVDAAIFAIGYRLVF